MWVCAGSEASLAAAEPPHTFVFTYRAFGSVMSTSTFQQAVGYAVRFEGCVAKHSDEAVCGFTLRARDPLLLTNVENVSHGSSADGSRLRTCCVFVQGDDRGYPITSERAGAAGGGGVLRRPLKGGEMVGVLLRGPNYRSFSPLAAITFSRGEGDPGISFAGGVVERP